MTATLIASALPGGEALEKDVRHPAERHVGPTISEAEKESDGWLEHESQGARPAHSLVEDLCQPHETTVASRRATVESRLELMLDA